RTRMYDGIKGPVVKVANSAIKPNQTKMQLPKPITLGLIALKIFATGKSDHWILTPLTALNFHLPVNSAPINTIEFDHGDCNKSLHNLAQNIDEENRKMGDKGDHMDNWPLRTS